MRREYHWETELPVEAVQCRLTLATDQYWYRIKGLPAVINMQRRGIRFIGVVRSSEFNVALVRIAGHPLGGPWAHGFVSSAGGKTRVKIVISYRRLLAGVLVIMILFPLLFWQVLGYLTSVVVPVAALITWATFRIQVFHLVKELGEALLLKPVI